MCEERRSALLLGLLLGQRRADAQLVQFLHQVAVLVHLEQDVAAAHKLTVDVHLGDGGPVGELLDAWWWREETQQSQGRRFKTPTVSLLQRSLVRNPYIELLM